MPIYSKYPTFRLSSYTPIVDDVAPAGSGGVKTILIGISAAHLRAGGADVSWWVTSDEPSAFWGASWAAGSWQSTLPSGRTPATGAVHLSGAATTFDKLVIHDTGAAMLDSAFTVHFYPFAGVTMVGASALTITIQDAHSALNGDASNNVINGTAGNDVVNARGGDDLVNLGAGNDQASGGDGNDTLNGGDGNDYLRGDAGNDHLNGGNGADILSGGAGNDVIYGGAGNDLIIGGVGNDSLYGGSGADTFVFQSPSEGLDLIGDFTPGQDHIRIDLKGWGLSGAPGVGAPHTPSGPEFYFDGATHTLFYTPSAESDVPVTYAIATLPGVSALHASDFIFVG